MQQALRLAMRRCWLGGLVAAVLLGVLAELKAQPASDDGAQVLAADNTLGQATRGGNRSVARKLLSLQFSAVDEDGKVRARKEFLADLRSVAATPASDATVKIYGRVAMVIGHHRSAHGNDTFFLDIWAKQKGSWRTLIVQDVALAAAGAKATAASATQAKPAECKNPCQTIPYRVRSPAEQDIVNAFQAIEKAAIANDADEWAKHVADEFVLYRSGHAPMPKTDRLADIKRRKAQNVAVTIREVQTMRLSVYGDGAAMIATQGVPDGSPSSYRAARVWVKRNNVWQMAIGAQTDVKSP